MGAFETAVSPVLADSFGRRIDYLRLSITDRCNFRCRYCLPDGFDDYREPEEWLTFDEMERLIRLFAALGVAKVRLTGGEPLTRRGLPELTRRIASVPGVADLSLSTNGALLRKLAAPLREAGLTRLNVSLDSIHRERFRAITGRDALEQVLLGLASARASGFSPIKINTVLLGDCHDGEIESLVEYCLANGFTLRLIEAMPIGEPGRAAAYVDLRPVRERLRRRYGLTECIVPGGGPAQYLRSAEGFTIGFITAVSQHFCDTCNRVRLSVDGTLRACLGDEGGVALRPLLRGGAGDSEVAAAIRRAVEAKPARHQFREKPGKVMRVMAMTGG